MNRHWWLFFWVTESFPFMKPEVCFSCWGRCSQRKEQRLGFTQLMITSVHFHWKNSYWHLIGSNPWRNTYKVMEFFILWLLLFLNNPFICFNFITLVASYSWRWWSVEACDHKPPTHWNLCMYFGINWEFLFFCFVFFHCALPGKSNVMLTIKRHNTLRLPDGVMQCHFSAIMRLELGDTVTHLSYGNLVMPCIDTKEKKGLLLSCSLL